MKIIKLTQNQIALIDDDDYERVNQYRWCAKWHKKLKSFYAGRTDYTNSKQKTILMHRFILNIIDPKILVDHISHYTLDNRKENLRKCTHQQNMYNRKIQNHSSKFKGVTWHKQKKKWQAQIRINKLIYLGSFDTELDAYHARLEAEKIYHGEFALKIQNQ